MKITYLFTLVILSCKSKEPSNVSAPGEEKTGKTKALEAGAAALQDKTP